MRIYRNDSGEVILDGEGDIVLSNTNHCFFIDGLSHCTIKNFNFTGNRMDFWDKIKFIFKTIHRLFNKRQTGEIGIEIGGNSE